MRPPIQYFGAKTSIAERIVSLLPAHDGYVEPFAGSLSVLLAKEPSSVEVVNDLDGKLMTFWRVLRDRPDDLLRLAELTPHSRAELARAAALDADDELKLAHQVWILLTQGRSRTMHRTGWRFFSEPNRGGANFQQYLDAYRDRLEPAARRLMRVSLECRPALDVIAQYGVHAGNLFYVDPPYLAATRRGGRYSHEMSSAREHEALAAALHEVRGPVVLSGYHSDLYDQLFADWHVLEMAAFTGNATSGSGARTEVLWSSVPLAGAVSVPLFDEDGAA